MKLISLGTTFLLMLFSFAVLTAIPAHAGADKVTVCHATGSETNPYVMNTVALEAFISPGNSEHGHGSHEADIYPAFQYTKKNGEIVDVPSRNWDTEIVPGMPGSYLYEVEGCEVPVETEEPPVPVVAPVAPIYVPGDCITPAGSVTLQEQPEGVILAEGSPSLVDNVWTTVYLVDDEHTFPNGEESITFTSPVQGPTEDCELPEMGAGDILMYAGGALLLLGLGAGAMHVSRRQDA